MFARLAATALTIPAPFDAWTSSMKATLNADGEELIFTFYYE